MNAELFSAAASGNVERIRELLASDPSAAQVKDNEGATALHHAALNGHREIVRVLLEQGADVNARDDRFGATPAGWTIEYLREVGGLLAIEIEDVLFAIGQKDVPWLRRFLTRLPTLAQARDAHGKPLSEHAIKSGNDEIARLFETALRQCDRDR